MGSIPPLDSVDIHLNARPRRAGAAVKVGALGVVGTASSLLILITYTLRSTMKMNTGWKDFALHPVLMTMAFGFIAPISATSYRALEDILKLQHSTAKLVHSCLMTAALVCGIAGVVNMWIVHDKGGQQNHLISVHSWVGLAALIAFGVQWLTGLLSFYTPLLERCVTKRAWLPVHIFIGSFAVYGTLVAIVLGLLSFFYPTAKTAATTGGEGPKAYVTPEQLQGKYAALLAMALACFVAMVLHGGRDRY